MTTSQPRPLRADARRNRERLIEVAARAFGQDGPEVTLEAVAKEAGVGIGTLYRHFATREELVDAAYRSELAKLCDSAAELLDRMAPDAALRAWMDGFVAYMSTKRGMSDALRALVASGGDPFSHSRAMLTAAIGDLLWAGIAADVIRPDLEPEDVLFSLSGLSLAATTPEHRARMARLLDLLMDGFRHRP
ncbi:TetR/AcrR family transcriptional regulator [Streptacidiphilus jiangxiensis]|uniref:DNA-binding transcriptional regulator, AcrR family n=1 Tax=Streptacidiphilus jiangxiensis TaxID=235985 RepID=A0A1H7TBI3_STRJI|nr:TetR/AcrR family transcriptional regulator [Streptacidiphilus jiangxiensis]SEL81869.1 DNA-binding transcriptional regulator, AcrR family [Streptacidiphilus jiangxiensis]